MKELWKKFQARNERIKRETMEKWAVTRRKGDIRYIALNMLLIFSILTVPRLITHFIYHSVYLRELIAYIIISLLASLVFAIWNWHSSERKYRQYIKTQIDADDRKRWLVEFMAKR